jgi:serine/threonine protein kinase
MGPNHLFFVQSADRVGIQTPNIIEFFISSGKPPSYSSIVTITKEILLAFQYVHAKGISHLDLSHKSITCLENFQELMDAPQDAEPMAKKPHVQLTGFGKAFGFRKKNINSQTISSVSNCECSFLKLYYMAPERLQGQLDSN